MKKVITCELKGKVATPENKKANSDVLTTTVESQASFGGFQGESGVMIGGQAVQAMTMDSSADISVLNALAAGIAIKRDQIRLSLQNYNVDLDNKATKAGNENIALPEEIEEHDPAKQSMLGAKVTGTTFILNTQPASTSSNEDVRTQTVNEPVNNLVTPPVVIQHNLSSSFQTAPVLHSDPPIQTLNYEKASGSPPSQWGAHKHCRYFCTILQNYTLKTDDKHWNWFIPHLLQMG